MQGHVGLLGVIKAVVGWGGTRWISWGSRMLRRGQPRGGEGVHKGTHGLTIMPRLLCVAPLALCSVCRACGVQKHPTPLRHVGCLSNVALMNLFIVNLEFTFSNNWK